MKIAKHIENIEVIKITYRRGGGTNDATWQITEYWTKDGELLARQTKQITD